MFSFYAVQKVNYSIKNLNEICIGEIKILFREEVYSNFKINLEFDEKLTVIKNFSFNEDNFSSEFLCGTNFGRIFLIKNCR